MTARVPAPPAALAAVLAAGTALADGFADAGADVAATCTGCPEIEATARGTGHDLDPEILALEGDPDYGAYLSNECVTCHQADGSAQGIPSITGWPTKNFVVAMHAYKAKLRPHPVMQMVAGRLNDAEIAALAAYFQGLE